MTKEIQPVFILADDTKRNTGKSAQKNNILAAKLVADTIRTTLGPKGMDKMLVDSAGEITVTNDGVTILEEMHIEHPAAKMIVEVARTQENEIGDGTTTAVILAGELLSEAEKLLDDKVHPTIIIKGFHMAEKKARGALELIARPISKEDTDLLSLIAQTAMTGKGAEVSKETLANLAVKAALTIYDNGKIDKECIKIVTKPGANIEHSKLVEGIVLDKERVHPSMPLKVDNAKVLLLDTPLEIKETETDARITIQDPSHMQAFLDMEEQMITSLTNKIISSGVKAVFCQKGIDELAAYQLAKAGVFAVRRIKKSDMQILAKATGAKIISNVKSFTADDLGVASVKQEVLGDEQAIFISGGANAKAVTILLRAGTNHVLDELKRAVSDAIGDIRSAILSGKIVPGAGATEMFLSNELKKYASSLSGREQLAVLAFAKALESIPRTLAENAGLDPIDILVDLRSANKQTVGINVFTGQVEDAFEMGVLEPLHIKTQALSSAVDVATMILRIDDVIASDPVVDSQSME